MPSYAVLLREDPEKFAALSPSQMQEIIQKYTAWFGKLGTSGRMEVARKLTDDGGRHVRQDKGRMVVSDGPYAEAKDIVSGIFIVEAASYDEITQLLADCPHMEFGWLEVREVDALARPQA